MKKWIRAKTDCIWRKEYDSENRSYYYSLSCPQGRCHIEYDDNDGDGFYRTYIWMKDGTKEEKHIYPLDKAKKYAEDALRNAAITAASSIKAKGQQKMKRYISSATNLEVQEGFCFNLGNKDLFLKSDSIF